MNLYYEMLRHPVFSLQEVKAKYASERTARAALEKLLKEGMAYKIRNGLYTCVSGENGGPVADRFQVASAVTPSSYVSHHTAFEYYGAADQVYHEVYVSSDTRFHDFEFDGYKYHFVRSKTREGVAAPQFGGGVSVTSRERTIIDSIKDLNRISGLEEVIACMLAVKGADESNILRCLEAYGSAFLYQKTGFIAELFQGELGASDEFIRACKSRAGNSKRYLTAGISNPAYAGEWGLVYPKNIKEIKNGGLENAAV